MSFVLVCWRIEILRNCIWWHLTNTMTSLNTIPIMWERKNQIKTPLEFESIKVSPSNNSSYNDCKNLWKLNCWKRKEAVKSLKGFCLSFVTHWSCQCQTVLCFSLKKICFHFLKFAFQTLALDKTWNMPGLTLFFFFFCECIYVYYSFFTLIFCLL